MLYKETPTAPNKFEVILIFEYGESDMIDVDSIEAPHINRFLKTVANALVEIKKFDRIYHGNVKLENIVLMGHELKISGLKHLHLKGTRVPVWKREVITTHSFHRLDLFLLGMLWLKLSRTALPYNTDDLALSELRAIVAEALKTVDKGTYSDILEKLLDLDGHPDITLEDVISEFDQYFIIENKTIVDEIRIPSKKNLSKEGSMQKSFSRDSNPFVGSYRESFRDDRSKSGRQSANPDQQLVTLDGAEFTLHGNSLVKHETGELIKI